MMQRMIAMGSASGGGGASIDLNNCESFKYTIAANSTQAVTLTNKVKYIVMTCQYSSYGIWLYIVDVENNTGAYFGLYQGSVQAYAVSTPAAVGVTITSDTSFVISNSIAASRDYLVCCYY